MRPGYIFVFVYTLDFIFWSHKDKTKANHLWWGLGCVITSPLTHLASKDYWIIYGVLVLIMPWLQNRSKLRMLLFRRKPRTSNPSHQSLRKISVNALSLCLNCWIIHGVLVLIMLWLQNRSKLRMLLLKRKPRTPNPSHQSLRKISVNAFSLFWDYWIIHGVLVLIM